MLLLFDIEPLDIEPLDIEPFDIEPFDIEEDEDDPVCAAAGRDRVSAIAVASAAIVTRFIEFSRGFWFGIRRQPLVRSGGLVGLLEAPRF